jgi:hypothetical protein
MPAGVTTAGRMDRIRGGAQNGINRFEPHSALQRAVDELTDRDRAALGEEGPHAQIGIHALDFRLLDIAARERQ